MHDDFDAFIAEREVNDAKADREQHLAENYPTSVREVIAKIKARKAKDHLEKSSYDS